MGDKCIVTEQINFIYCPLVSQIDALYWPNPDQSMTLFTSLTRG
ncbi:hypothetical protein [Reichenbachiella sp. MALMAid0571]